MSRQPGLYCKDGLVASHTHQQSDIYLAAFVLPMLQPADTSPYPISRQADSE